MTRIVGLTIAMLAIGCANSYQSARVLAPGKTQVTVGVSRVDIISDGGGDDEALWLGDLQVRHGMGPKFEGGFRLQRSPGTGEAISILGFDPKFALTDPASKTAISIGVPISVLWFENGSDFEDGTILVTPSLFIGLELSPTVELVISPKVFYIKPDGADAEVELGGSIGVRFGDASRSWAVHPELGIVHFSEGDGESFLMFGVGISAGN